MYSCDIPDRLKQLVAIVQLEAANAVMVCKLWGKDWRDSKVILWCDNIAVVHAFESHKIKDN